MVMSNPHSLLFWRRKDGLFIGLVLLCWVWTNLWAALHYVPWRDVSQAWMIVRQLSVGDMLAQLRYEGHPFLWYLLLLPLTKTGIPFGTITVLSFACMFAGVWLYLCAAPTGKLQKLVVVFSGACMYYLPVEARSYALVPLLLMLLYICYPTRHTKPLRYAVVLFLLCQLHVLLCGLIGMLMLQWAIEAVPMLKTNKQSRIVLVLALVIMLAGVALLLWQMMGSIGTNQSVTISSLGRFTELRQHIFMEISTGSRLLTTISLYEYGNTGWWLTVLPLIACIAVLAVVWLWRAPRSALIMLTAFIWQLAVHVLVYYAHTQHLITFLWMLIFCVFLGCDEIEQKPLEQRRQIDKPLCSALLCLMLMICALTYGQTYTQIMQATSSEYLSSEGARAADYIQTQLPEDAVVLVDSEDMASPVAAYLEDGKLYNPARKNGMIFALHDQYSSGWCTYGDLDATLVELRAKGEQAELYLLADAAEEKAAQEMSARSVAKLKLIARFEDASREKYLLYKIAE